MQKDDVYFAIGTVLALLAFFGVDWQLIRGRLAMANTSRVRATLTPILILASLAMSAYGFYSTHHARFSSHMEPVMNKNFLNEVVELDGKDFENCTFTNVTFDYEGRGLVSFNHDHFVTPIVFQSSNPIVLQTFYNLKATGQYVGTAVDENGKPITNIQSPRLLP